MFKKMLCCLLACAMMISAMPTLVLAGESCDALKEFQGMRYIDKLCAVNANAPAWHEGMKLTHANSLQMETALISLLNDQILPTLEYLEETVTAQIATGNKDSLSDELIQARNDCRALRDEVQAELEIIEYERRFIPTSTENILSGMYPTTNQAETAARRTLVGVQRLEDSMEVVSGSYPDWEEEIGRMSKLVFPDDKPSPKKIAPKTPMEAHIINVRADYMNVLLSEAKRVAREEQGFASGISNAQDEVEIYAVPRDKILFDIRDENNLPISDAQVLAWNAKTGSKFTGTYDADAEGYLFSTKSLGLEPDGYLEIGYEIKRNGYESHFANRHLCQGGDIFHTVLTVSDGSPYITGTAFNGEDMQWSQTNVYITDANDAVQTISVYLDQASAEANETVTMYYMDREGNPKQANAVPQRGTDGRIRADFNGEWCRIFKIGDPVRFSVNGNESDALESLLITNQPACNLEGANKPRYETDNATLMKRFLPSSDLLKIVFPEDVPVFGGSIISLGWPIDNLPVTVYAGLDGKFMILLSDDRISFNNFLDSKVADQEWKTLSQAELDREISNVSEEVEEEIKSVKSSFVKDNQSVSQSFIGKCMAWWTLFFCAQGKIETDEEQNTSNVSGQLSLGFNLGAKAELSKQVLKAPPISLNIGVSVGFGAMINGLFSGPLQNPASFDFAKLGVDFGAASILIPTSVYVSLGVAIKEIPLKAGVKGCISLNLALPIITDEYKENVTVALDMRITIYAQILTAHVDWLIARLGWTYENGKSGDVNGYVIGIGSLPKKSAKSGFGMPLTETSESTLLAGASPVLGESGIDSNDLEVDTSVIWNYEPSSVNGSKAIRTASTLPNKFEMYNGNSVDMTVWAENNRIMISANGLDNAQELVIPEDPEGAYTPLSLAKKGIESGIYKIIDVNANNGDCHYDYIGSFRMPVQVAVVSVTYAKSFKKQQQTIGEKTVEVTLPDETETLSMALVLTMNSTKPTLLTTDQGEPAAYVFLDTENAIREVYPYPCQIHLKESPFQSGLPCIDTAKSFGIVTGALFEDGTLTSQFYYYPNDEYYDEDSYSTFRLLETGTTEDIPVYIGVDEDGSIVSGIFPNVEYEEYAHFADGNSIDDFVLYDLADSDGEMTAFYLEKTAEEGLDALKAVPMKLDLGSSPRYAVFERASSEIWDFESDIPSTSLNMDQLINYHTLNATLYWFDTGLKKVGGSEEKQEIARVRGVYFDWFHHKASKPFTIATLYGEDGDNGAFMPNLAPLTSFQSGGQFYFARALEKQNQAGESDSIDWQQGAYRIYNAPVSNIIKMSVINAAAEYHAMSAGRSGNFTFTLLNDGNMPISSVTLRVSRILKQPDGTEIKEQVAEYNLNPLDETTNSATFWSVGSNVPDVRSGLAAVRRVDTVFDPMTGDTNSGALMAANDNPWLLQSFLPESVIAYKGSIAIPEDWDGLQLLRAEIVRAYGPIQTTASSAVAGLAMYDLENGGVYAVDEEGNVSGKPLLMANGAPLRVEKSQPLDLTVDTAEISLSCKMHEKNGEKYIAAAISQSGNTAMNHSTGNITLRAYINDETEYPTYVHTFKNHTTGDLVLNLDAPVSVLTGGHTVDKLTIVVSDEAEENVDLSMLNNYQVFYFNEGLRWSVQPQDQIVLTDGKAIFTAKAEGGRPPYTYRWFQIGQTGPREVGIGEILVLDHCKDEMNGDIIYCMATDAISQTIVSDRANLWVQKVTPPKTGDEASPYGWSALLVISLSMVVSLLWAEKKRFHRKG